MIDDKKRIFMYSKSIFSGDAVILSHDANKVAPITAPPAVTSEGLFIKNSDIFYQKS